jgi:hypothetical protein
MKTPMPDARQEGRGRIIECTPEAIQAIHAAVMTGYFQFVRGGLEVGGVLFGRVEGETVHVMASRPIAAAYEHGHGFSVGPGEGHILRTVLNAPAKEPALRGLVPVGWYRSKTQGGLELPEKDAALHAEWFPEPWQVALVLRPEWKKPTRAAFYVRDAAGTLRQAPEFLADPQGGVHRTVAAVEAAPAWITGEARPEEPEPAAAAPAGELEPESVESAGPVLFRGFGETRQGKRRSWWWLVAIILAAAATTGSVIAYGLRHGWFVRPARLHITLKDAARRLSVHWDRESPAILWAEEATLEIRDGDQQRTLHLSAWDLRAMEVIVGRTTGDVAVTLRARLPGGRIAEGGASFVAPGSPPPAGEPNNAASEAR